MLAIVPAAKKTAPAAKNTKKKEYGASAITVLEGLEAVRKRPGMYIGSTGERGLHHLVWEVVDNSVDEARAGHAEHVDVTVHPDNGVSVVNALSEWLRVEVRRDGHTWTQTYERGAPTGPVEQGAPTKETGTTITFMPDD